MKELTNRQQEVIGFIKEFISSHKYPPTVREIAGNFKFSAKSAHDHLKALQRKKYIKVDTNRSRAIELLNEDDSSDIAEDIIEIPIVGHVAAGMPLLAESNIEGQLKIPETMLKGRNHFALRVQGDSMINAGILDGDMAIFTQQNMADNGEIVVAMVDDDSFTLKKFYKEKNRVKLQAENPDYPPIYSQNVKVLGKLIFVFRAYE